VRQEGVFRLRYRCFNIFSATGADPQAHAVLATLVGGPFRIYSTMRFPGLSRSTDLTLVRPRGRPALLADARACAAGRGDGHPCEQPEQVAQAAARRRRRCPRLSAQASRIVLASCSVQSWRVP
jgi:hypothetical protein